MTYSTAAVLILGLKHRRGELSVWSLRPLRRPVLER